MRSTAAPACSKACESGTINLNIVMTSVLPRHCEAVDSMFVLSKCQAWHWLQVKGCYVLCIGGTGVLLLGKGLVVEPPSNGRL